MAGEAGPEASASRRPWPREVLAAILPPFVAFVPEWLYWSTSARWSLFYPAVFVSAWLGGFQSGVASILLSIVLLWWYLISPRFVLVKTDARDYAAAIIFIVMGLVISAVIRRVRRNAVQLAVALRSAAETTRQLQKALDERSLFSAVIENSSDLIGIADPAGKPLYLNPAGRQMIGLAPERSLADTSRADFYPPELRDMPEVINKGMFAVGRWQGESFLRHWQTGRRIPVSDTHFLVRDPDTKRLLGMATITRDISAEKQQRDELQHANQRLADAMRELSRKQRFLQGILDYSPNAIAIKDLDSRYVIVNKGFEVLTGRGADALGKTDLDLFPRRFAEEFRANDRTVRETRQPMQSEERIEEGDSATIFLVSKFPLLEESGRVFAIGAIATDITQRKRDEEALRQTARDLRAAQRVAHVGSWRWDLRTDSVVWSEELYRIFGRDPKKPPPRLLREATVFTRESTDRLRSAVEKMFIDGEPYELELEFVHPEGSVRWCSARGEPVRDATGRIVGVDGTATDITKLKELQRMRDEWTSVIAHDLRQPIGVIAMASDFLPELHGEGMSEKECSMVQRIRSAALMLKRMVDDLLDMSLLEANRLKLERRWIDPRMLVRETIDRLSHVTGDRVHVFDEHGLAPVFVDPMRIDQVLGNLISNAVKYGDENGDIVVRLQRANGEVEITVTNHGRGIDPDELPRLFNRFMRSRKTRGTGVPGLGLGLYISKGVIEAHGGRMWAESVPGKTTAFHVTLPCGAAKQEAA